MFGNADDPAKGRQMPDHYTCRAAKFGSISSPIGTQITQAVGFAWAAKMKKDDLATLVYFGEGATSSSEFHNGMNFAGVFKTPTVFFCRNNGWAISVPVERQTASASFAVKGVAYGIPGVRCDGNDLFAVFKVTRDAIAHAAARQGPDDHRGDDVPPLGSLDERRPEGVPQRRRGRICGRSATRSPASSSTSSSRTSGTHDKQKTLEAAIETQIKECGRQRRKDAASGARDDVRGRLRRAAVAPPRTTRRAPRRTPREGTLTIQRIEQRRRSACEKPGCRARSPLP